MMTVFAIIIGTFFLSLALSRFFIAISPRIGFVDRPHSERKHHGKPIPYGGGVAIYLATVIALGLFEWQTGMLTGGEITLMHLVGLALAGLIVIIGGILDDACAFSPKQSLVAPLFAALTLLSFGIGVSKVTSITGEALFLAPWISDVITFIWIMVIVYAVKISDGIDGLTGSIGAAQAGIIALLASSTAFYQPDVRAIALLFLAAILGFLVFNMRPAKLYLGEAGSVFIGLMLAALAVLSGSKVLTSVLVLAIPVLDLFGVMLRRVLDGSSAGFWKRKIIPSPRSCNFASSTPDKPRRVCGPVFASRSGISCCRIVYILTRGARKRYTGITMTRRNSAERKSTDSACL
jgi:UDP-GlcNAc:undecaprenyl-phosphate GlcNAc-1-phosphate transferase